MTVFTFAANLAIAVLPAVPVFGVWLLDHRRQQREIRTLKGDLAYLKQENANLETAFDEACAGQLIAQGKLDAEKAENEHLARDVAYLRSRLAPFTAPRKRDARGHFLKEVAA